MNFSSTKFSWSADAAIDEMNVVVILNIAADKDTVALQLCASGVPCSWLCPCIFQTYRIHLNELLVTNY